MSRLSIRQLEIVRAIMRTGGLTTAASALGISQPAASRLLRHAEDSLGFPLFERRANGLRPTHEAKAIYPEIDRVFSDLEFIERTAGDLARLQSGRLRVAAIPSIALTVLADALGLFRRTHPGVTVAIETALNYEVADLVLDRRVDLGLAYMPTRVDDLAVEEVGLTSVVLAVPKGHPFANRDSASVAEIPDDPFISFSSTLPIGEYISSALRAAGAERPVAIEVGHSFLACVLVRAGAGIAMVDRLAERSGLFGDLAFVPFDPPIPIRAALLTLSDQEPSLAARAFCETLRRVRD
ncbi:LysR family transcriptional regulator [Acuticoccus sp. M5D2P5]|uniref:LysR family transcriptional regulator n=1 Tax=Acuticoccus kalidii TaxID=2910977 RepID=UPI001F200715|nr:LysR family transcriptional regulator [Acuticoccus kalidii]MCF3935484.1 LysR family transcriptional regulator [Acuticoccus kalidii]